MSRKKQTQGICAYCGQQFAKSGMTKHLPVCQQRQAIIEQADNKKGADEILHHLRVQDAYGGDFWLDLEMRGTATLNALDHYLRAIWLECCGHMSQFGYIRWGPEISMRRRANEVFTEGVELTHLYDFGTTS